MKQAKEAPVDERFVGKEIVTEQPIHFSSQEIVNIQSLIDTLEKEPTKEELEGLLDNSPRDIDLAMFGRMIAKRPDKNREAAVQVAHAISINEVEIEPDFFTAVDDLNKHGSAHMGEQEFVSAVYYLYLCIDTEQLLKNLSNDKALAEKSIKAVVESAAIIAPSGKQNSYAHQAQPFYILAEKGNAQPRNLSLAFLKAMKADDAELAIEKLRSIKNKFNTAYTKPEAEKEMNLFGEGSLQTILEFVGEL